MRARTKEGPKHAEARVSPEPDRLVSISTQRVAGAVALAYGRARGRNRLRAPQVGVQSRQVATQPTRDPRRCGSATIGMGKSLHPHVVELHHGGNAVRPSKAIHRGNALEGGAQAS